MSLRSYTFHRDNVSTFKKAHCRATSNPSCVLTTLDEGAAVQMLKSFKVLL
jgi:hypothetical protein